MKIIDLYNLIANEEYDKLPKKIKYENAIYEYNEISNDYSLIDFEGCFLFRHIYANSLNNEVKILEEQKKMNKITLYGKKVGYGIFDEWLEKPNENEQKLASSIETIAIVVNEIIDKINEMENK